MTQPVVPRKGTVEADSAGKNLFTHHRVGFNLVAFALRLQESSLSKRLEGAPGDTALYLGEGMGLAALSSMRPRPDRSTLAEVPQTTMQAALTFNSGGATLSESLKGVLVAARTQAVVEPVEVARSKEKKKEKKGKKEKKDKKDKKEKSKSKDKNKEKVSTKRKRSDDEDDDGHR